MPVCAHAGQRHDASAAIGADMRARYEKFGIADILLQHPLDVQHDQLIPGRVRMLENFAALERHSGNVAAIDGNTAVMADGKMLDGIDVLLGALAIRRTFRTSTCRRLAACRRRCLNGQAREGRHGRARRRHDQRSKTRQGP